MAVSHCLLVFLEFCIYVSTYESEVYTHCSSGVHHPLELDRPKIELSPHTHTHTHTHTGGEVTFVQTMHGLMDSSFFTNFTQVSTLFESPHGSIKTRAFEHP